MALYDVFHNAVDTVFKVFESLLESGEYEKRVDAGWGDEDENPKSPMNVIVNGLTQEQLRNTRFYLNIEPSDTVIMVKGIDIITNAIEVKNSDYFNITFKIGGLKKFTIIDHETDPASALFLILLRERYNE